MMHTNEDAPAPVLASVVVLGMADSARQPAAERTALRAQLEALTGIALQPLTPADRIVLDAADALAVVVLEGPAAALALAERARAAAGELPLRVGVDYGPLGSVENPQRGPCLAGEGLGAALALADAAAPGDMLASPQFRAALAASSASAGTARAQRRWRTALFAAAASVLVALGVGARSLRPLPSPPLKPALLQSEIRPRSEVYLDGKMKGPTPPHRKPKKEPRKEAKKEVKKESKKEVNWGENIRSDFDNMKRKLGF